MSDWWTPGGGFNEFENIETVKCKHWECPYRSCICHESHELFKDDYKATFNNPEYCMKYLDE